MKTGTILMIEDDPNDADLARRALKRQGFTNPVEIVADGEQAIRYVKMLPAAPDDTAEELPALILVDLKIPKVDGFDVIRAIRAHPWLRLLPVVVFTSSYMATDVESAYEAGACSYVRKPVKAEEYTQVIGLVARYWLDLNTDAAEPSLD